MPGRLVHNDFVIGLIGTIDFHYVTLKPTWNFRPWMVLSKGFVQFNLKGHRPNLHQISDPITFPLIIKSHRIGITRPKDKSLDQIIILVLDAHVTPWHISFLGFGVFLDFDKEEPINNFFVIRPLSGGRI